MMAIAFFIGRFIGKLEKEIELDETEEKTDLNN